MMMKVDDGDPVHGFEHDWMIVNERIAPLLHEL